jgi:hypothetical protein
VARLGRVQPGAQAGTGLLDALQRIGQPAPDVRPGALGGEPAQVSLTVVS